MKNILLRSLVLAFSVVISSCISVTQKAPVPSATTTTTTEETSTSRPGVTTVETQTTRTR